MKIHNAEFNYFNERRKRLHVPKSIFFLSLFLLFLPILNIIYLGVNSNLDLVNYIKIPLKLPIISNFILFFPVVIGILLLTGKKIGWYFFLIYTIGLIFQNIYSIILYPSIQNSGSLFRTIFWFGLCIFICSKDISVPFMKIYPRGWRGEKRQQVKIPITIDNIDYLTEDASIKGVYIKCENFPYQVSDSVNLKIVTKEKIIELCSGVVRKDNNGVGLAFRGVGKEDIQSLKVLTS
jgi:hypothetical protein